MVQMSDTVSEMDQAIPDSLTASEPSSSSKSTRRVLGLKPVRATSEGGDGAGGWRGTWPLSRCFGFENCLQTV